MMIPATVLASSLDEYVERPCCEPWKRDVACEGGSRYVDAGTGPELDETVLLQFAVRCKDHSVIGSKFPRQVARAWHSIARLAQRQVQLAHQSLPKFCRDLTSTLDHYLSPFPISDPRSDPGWREAVALLRLSPLMPYTVLNHALGITGIGAWDYLIGSTAILPGTLVYTYYGTAIANLAGLAGGAHRGAAFYVLMAVGVVATIAVTVLIARLAHHHLRHEVTAA